MNQCSQHSLSPSKARLGKIEFWKTQTQKQDRPYQFRARLVYYYWADKINYHPKSSVWLL